MERLNKILVTGGAGYVGSVLCSKLLDNGYFVRVLDLMIYDSESLEQCKNNPNFDLIKGDIRDKKTVEKSVEGMDCIIHLAAISNDPTCELDEKLTKSVNYNAVKLLLKMAKKNKVKRFINASSSSMYGVNEKEDVTEEAECNPISLYAKYKLESEKLINQAQDENFTVVNIRPATICGYSPRMRFDLTVNALVKDAVTKGFITVHGGEQRRPNVTISDITDLYMRLINEKKELIAGQTFNAGFENLKVIETAKLVQKVLAPREIKIVIANIIDPRDYHISSEKIKKQLGFQPKFTVKDMILELAEAFEKELIPNPENDKYYNIRKMKIEHFK